nr:hypothetical protein [Tanacetum cinerariifolium]
MASNPENVRLSVLAKLQEALDEEDIMADHILTMMHRYADRFTNRRVEINNLMPERARSRRLLPELRQRIRRLRRGDRVSPLPLMSW